MSWMEELLWQTCRWHLEQLSRSCNGDRSLVHRLNLANWTDAPKTAMWPVLIKLRMWEVWSMGAVLALWGLV